MIHRINLAGVLLLGSAALISCQESPEPRSILTKAIAAHGGEKNIAKPRRGVLKGIQSKNSYSDEMTLVDTFDLPKQWKKVGDVKFKGQRTITTLLAVDGKFWSWKEGAEPQARQDDGGVKPYIGNLSTLINLVGDGVKLSPLKEIKINDMPAVGFRASWDGGKADYYFDKGKGLLLAIDRKMPPESRMVWSDYKEMDGLQLPHKVSTYKRTDDSEDYVLVDEFAVTEIRFLDDLPDGAFSLPKK
jgi:hypothetical protein